MKQSTVNSTNKHYSLSTLVGDDEIKVSDILLNLPNLISESESRCRFPITWGAKGRRSALDLSLSRPLRLPPSSPPTLQKTSQDETETERRPKVKVEASSPATPLSFSPSESDDKSKQSHNKTSKKRTREDWLKIIDELTRRRELLRGEIGTVESYYKKLKAFNLVLKAKKQELSFCVKIERKAHLESSKSLNIGMELDQFTAKSHTMLENQEHRQIPFMVHQQPFIVNQTAYGSQICEKFQYPYGRMSPLLSSSSGLGAVNHMGPLVIPDLNVPVEETLGMDAPQPFDLNRALADNRAKAAEARRRRMIRIKEMKNSSFAAIKPPPFR